MVAIGLVFITRSFASSLKGLESVETYSTFIQLAQTVWIDLEADMQEGQLLRREQEGSFEEPFEGYQWRLSRGYYSGQKDEVLANDIVTLKIRRIDGKSSVLTQHAVWPVAKIPDTW